MAKILLGDGIGDKRGKQGGTVYSRNRYANYTRQKTIPVNPNTIRQSAVRSSFGNIASGWRSLSEAQRNAWTSLAAALAPTNIFGQTFAYTGFNVYMLSSQTLQAAGMAILSVPDVVPPVFPVLTNVISADVSDTKLDYASQFDGSPISPAGFRLVVQATPPVAENLGSASVKKLFRYLITTDVSEDFTTPLNLYSAYTSLFGSDGFTAGNNVWIRTKMLHADTGLSTPWLLNVTTIIT